MLRSEWPEPHPIPPDGLPYCPTCQGMRRVYQEPRPGELTGKLAPCPACGAQVAQQRRARLFWDRQAIIQQYTHLRGRAVQQTFATFKARGVSPAVKKAYAAAIQFATRPQGFLILAGDVGVGKSHLAAAIANFQAAQDDPRLTLFFIVPDLLDMLRSGYGRGDYEALLTLTRDCDLLILDDLGTESQTDWASEKLFTLINHRYQAWLPTVVVTNCALEDLEPRLRSRLMERGFAQHVILSGDDYRLRGQSS